MTKITEVQKLFDGTVVDEMTCIDEVSAYNSNYYMVFNHLLYGESDDDNTTEWWLIRGDWKPVYLGYSLTSDEPEKIIMDSGF